MADRSSGQDPVGPPPPPTTVTPADIEPKSPASGPGSGGAQSKSRTRHLIEWIVVLVAAGITTFLGYYVDSTKSDGGSAYVPGVAVSSATGTVVPGQTGPPPGAWICPSIYQPAGTLTHSAVDTPVTTCLFAEEVRRAYGLPDPLGLPRTITLTSNLAGPPVSAVCTTSINMVTCKGEGGVVYLF